MNKEELHELIENIHAGKYSEKELLNLYNNALRLGKAEVMDAVKLKLRADFPRAASRKFGAKESEAEGILAGVYGKVSTLYNLGKNRVRNGVKAGGEMISGKRYIEVYISYKNKTGFGTFLGLAQDTVDSELIARVGKYRTGNKSFNDERTYKMQDFDQAIESYKVQLNDILSKANAVSR